MKRTLLLTGLTAGLSGCMLLSSPTGTMPRSGAFVPDTTVNVTSTLAVKLEKLVYWGAYAGVAYLILDPLAPNWDIEQAEFPADQYHLSLHMKRYYNGGAGEARDVFHRRAKDIAREHGFDGYQVMQYTEGLESSVLGPQRNAQGVIRLTRADEG
ncbi:MAG: hypothetical protein ACM3Y9_08020 [Ignavibacteria bacterium]